MNALRALVVVVGLALVLPPMPSEVYAEEAADQFDCAACHLGTV